VEVQNALAGASFITAGRIDTNTTQVSIQANYRPKLKRIESIAGQRDSLGRRYVFGAFAGKKFDYYAVADPTALNDYAYNLSVKQPHILYFSDSVYVPAPLVMPGGWSRITDMSRPPLSSDWNPLDQFDEVVEYNQHGAILKGGAWSIRERVEAIQMALIAGRDT
jgi:hypothetical protein